MSRTAKKSSNKDKSMGCLINAQSLGISENLSPKDGPRAIRTWLMSSRQDFPVSRTQSPENNSEQKTREICGPPLAKLSRSSSHPTPFWKTSQVLFQVDISESFLETFPKSGTMRDGKLYQRRRVEPVINGIGCGSWPTPNKSDGNGSGRKAGTQRKDGKKKSSLKDVVNISMAIKVWPTPNCSSSTGAGLHGDGGPNLQTAVKMFPIPASGGVTGGAVGLAGGSGNRKKLYKMFGEAEGKKMGSGQLNPDWCCWLMNWPVGWSSLEPITELRWLNISTDPHPHIPRVTTAKKNRTNRLKVIGNGQVPIQAATAWKILITGLVE